METLGLIQLYTNIGKLNESTLTHVIKTVKECPTKSTKRLCWTFFFAPNPKKPSPPQRPFPAQ
jgi:hypothetical protein